MEDEIGYQSFVKIAEDEGNDVMELPRERDGTVLLSTVQAQFPNAIGLKYKSSSGGWRGIRAVDNVLDPPFGGWGETTYYITQSDALKRKSSNDSNGHPVKSRKSENLLQDIVVFGLPYSTTNDELEEYFKNSCGELAFHEVKYDRETKKPRGFGFIRFKTEEGAKAALKGNHEMLGRRLEIRVSKKKENPMKLFIGRLPKGATDEDVKEYFSEFGELDDVFVPTPFRGFAFITFASQEDGKSALRMNHVLQGARLNVKIAEPKEEKPQREQTNYGQSDYSWKPGSDRSSDWNRDRSSDRNSDRNGDRFGDRYDRNSDRKTDRYSDRSNDRNDVRSNDRSSDRNSDRFGRDTSYDQHDRYKSRNSQDPPAKKDISSELKTMLFTLLSSQK